MAICQICETRKARRYCPGVRGDICSICCGTEREVTVDCPFECPYLEEAREREKLPAINPDTFPNQDIRVSDRFLTEREPILLFLSGTLTGAALTIPGVIDYDIRDALQALIKTYRTLQTGLYYDSKPTNPIAAAIYEEVQRNVHVFREQIAQQQGIHTIRDADILGLLVFLERMELQHNNGRRKGRAFIDFLRHYFPSAGQIAQGQAPDQPEPSRLIL